MNKDILKDVYAVERIRDELSVFLPQKKAHELNEKIAATEIMLQTEDDIRAFVDETINLVQQFPEVRERLKELINSGTKYSPLAGEQFEPIDLGPVMMCSKDSKHPHVKLIREGQTCRFCGAKLIKLKEGWS